MGDRHPAKHSRMCPLEWHPKTRLSKLAVIWETPQLNREVLPRKSLNAEEKDGVFWHVITFVIRLAVIFLNMSLGIV